MSGTALYRALVHAGAPESEAKEASDAVEGKFDNTAEQLRKVNMTITELKVTSRITLALVAAILIKSFF